MGEGDFVAGGEDGAFFEGDFARDVDVEEVDFAVGGEEGARGGEEEGGVVVFLSRGDVFGDAAAEEVGFCFEGEGGEGVVGGGLGGGGGGGEEGFGVFGEVLRAVGGVEAFGEDY